MTQYLKKLEAKLAGAVLSNTAKRIQGMSSGFDAKLYGSEHNDRFKIREDGHVENKKQTGQAVSKVALATAKVFIFKVPSSLQYYI